MGKVGGISPAGPTIKIRAGWRFWSRWIKASSWLGWVQINSTECLLFSIAAVQAILG
jgi:hypothetical protein